MVLQVVRINFNILKKMTRLEKLECLLEIQEAIESFERRIEEKKWENEFGAGLHFQSINIKYTDRIDTYERCIDRLNERFSKRLNTLK